MGLQGINIFGPYAFRQVRYSKTTLRNILYQWWQEGLLIYLPHHASTACNGTLKIIHQKTKQWLLHKQQSSETELLNWHQWGTDIISFDRITHDGSYRKCLRIYCRFKIGTVTRAKLPQVNNVNSGFYEPASKIKYGTQFYANYIAGSPNCLYILESGWTLLEDMEPGCLPHSANAWLRMIPLV